MFLIAASLFFYAFGEPVYVLLMVLSIIVNYSFARSIAGSSRRINARRTLIFSIVFNLSLLVFFKYTNFIVDNLNAITGLTLKVAQISLPIGISFFTFHALSYVIDVYRDRTILQDKLSNAALYISFFPQLIAGPVIKYHDIALQIEKRSMSPEKTLSGIRRFIIGLAKKLLIANTLGRIADLVFAMDSASLTSLEAWTGAVAYTLQIYFDFSGYSDMAIGLGRMFGFEIMENFNYPFIAGSIKNFWRRWHISLTTWFREYLYFSLGGNRKGLKRTCLNMFIVFLLTGFWHGAAWTFLIWGLFHGFFLILETLGVIKTDKFKIKALGNIYTLFVVIVGFAVFRAENLQQAFDFLCAMLTKFNFTMQNAILAAEVLSPLLLVTAAAAVLASFPIAHAIRDKESAGIAGTISAERSTTMSAGSATAVFAHSAAAVFAHNAAAASAHSAASVFARNAAAASARNATEASAHNATEASAHNATEASAYNATEASAYNATEASAHNARVLSAVDAFGYVLAFFLLILCILNISSSTYNPFIYFRF